MLFKSFMFQSHTRNIFNHLKLSKSHNHCSDLHLLCEIWKITSYILGLSHRHDIVRTRLSARLLLHPYTLDKPREHATL